MADSKVKNRPSPSSMASKTREAEEETQTVDQAGELEEPVDQADSDAETSETEAESTEEEEDEEAEANPLTGTNPFPGFMSGFATKILEANSQISAHNVEMTKLAAMAKSAGMSSYQVLSEAKKLARPVEDDTKPNAQILTLLEAYEKAQETLNSARSSLVATTAKSLGVDLAQEAPEPDKDIVEALKVARKSAVAIAKQLVDMASNANPNDPSRKELEAWLAANPILVIGSDRVLDVTDATSGLARYRVDVTASINGQTLTVGTEEFKGAKGFTKAAQLASKSGKHKRGESPDRDDFRKAWEAAGNTPDKTVQSTVDFTKDEVTYRLVKRPSK
jgi:hypothetical protein